MPITDQKVSDINIKATEVLPSPDSLWTEIPRTAEQEALVLRYRSEIHEIIFGTDKRFLLVVGPCSIHDTEAAMEYAQRLKKLSDEVQDRMLLVMRVYFEKPRTSIGWKGLIMDPRLDGSYDIPLGLRNARKILCDVLDIGLPTSTELLDPVTPQYIADLVCWSAIGARTTESQTHRQMASGLSMPLGFKNGTDGAIDTAINAIKAAGHPQTFLGIDAKGRASAVSTRGNPACHIVLRGGKHGPNFSRECVQETEALLRGNELIPAVMVDCSHSNSQKRYELQVDVMRDLMSQLEQGDDFLIGAMLESNLNPGAQALQQPISDLKYGVSITDPCLGWEDTEAIIRECYERLACRNIS